MPSSRMPVALELALSFARVLLAAPVRAAGGWLAARRVRAFFDGAAPAVAHGLRVEGERLRVTTDASSVVPLAAITSARVQLVRGDAGFADANTLRWQVSLTLDDGQVLALEHFENHPFPFATEVLAPMRARGVLRGEVTEIDGPPQGPLVALIALGCLGWVLAAWMLVAWLQGGGLQAALG